MGVPAFYRWLADRYPKIVQNVVEEEVEEVEGVEVPFDATCPNPNGIEFDNLYLDMNGIIHPCFHPEDRPAPTTEKEVFQNIFEYIDRLFRMIRPRKLLYMAIDGVAPRAKMNQQRSRRFRAAQEAEERARAEAKLRGELLAEGVKLPPPAPKSEVFDSNGITPGTPFMTRLSTALQYYIHLRLNRDKAWRDVKVILSDSNVPGEGEHKIMAYIREQRGLPGWNPNTRHVVYGLDADLIMLGLSTHEPWFYILREMITAPQQKDPREALLEAARGLPAETKPAISKKPYQLLKIHVLREYLTMDMTPRDEPFRGDPERLFDDFVFMCFFVGNDFLPHMPTLEIREGAIVTMMNVYRRELPRMGHLTKGAHVYLDRVEHFIQIIGSFEDMIFSKRAKRLEGQKRRRARDKAQKDRDTAAANSPYGQPNSPYGAAGSPYSSGNSPYGGGANGSGGPRGERGGKKSAADKRLDEAAHMARMVADAIPLNMGGDTKATARPWDCPKGGAGDKGGAASANKDAAAELRAKIMSGIKRPREEKGGGHKKENGKAVKGEEGHAGAVKAEEGLEGAVEIEGSDAGQGGSKGETKTTTAFWDALAVKKEENGADETPPKKAKLENGAPGTEEKISEEDRLEAEKVLKERMKAMMDGQSDMFDAMVEQERNIRLGEAGWRERYYAEKLGTTPENIGEARRRLAKAFVEGICWVMKYYYDGVASWGWYYPEHYAPFASDLKDLSSLDIRFDLGTPFKPFNQLMGVLPAASSHCLPEPYRWLFDRSDSPILEFYPKHFKLDMNGKPFAWQAVALLPFIDEQRLLDAVAPCEKKLSPEEQYRNTQRLDLLFVHAQRGATLANPNFNAQHPVAPAILEVAEMGRSAKTDEDRAKISVKMDPAESRGMNGFIVPCGGEAMPKVVSAPYGLGEPVRGNSVVLCNYRLPEHHPHECRVLEGTIMPEKELTEMDMPAIEDMWHLTHGGGGMGRGGGRHGGGRHAGPQQRLGVGWDRSHIPVAQLDASAHRFLQHEMASRGPPAAAFGAPPGRGPPAPVGRMTFAQQQGHVAPGRGMARGWVPPPGPRGPPLSAPPYGAPPGRGPAPFAHGAYPPQRYGPPAGRGTPPFGAPPPSHPPRGPPMGYVPHGDPRSHGGAYPGRGNPRGGGGGYGGGHPARNVYDPLVRRRH